MVSRRTFLFGAAAAVCVGCDDDGDPLFAPSRKGSSFGDVIDVGTVADVEARIDQGAGFAYVSEARAWIVRYPPSGLEAAERLYDASTVAGLEAGFIALYQKCPHLGCRVPQCTSSQRFECPCHQSVFNHVGEWVSGPARRGMDRFPLRVVGDHVLVDTRSVLPGLDQHETTVEPVDAGPPCITGG